MYSEHMNDAFSKTELTNTIIAELNAERDRTSVGPQALLKPFGDNKPKGLNHAMVTHWLGGRIKTAKSEHVEFVIAAWAELETNRSIEMTEQLLAELRAMQAAAGINAEMMVRWSEAGSVGLSVSKIKHYMSGKAKTVQADHVTLMKRIWGEKAGSKSGAIESQ